MSTLADINERLAQANEGQEKFHGDTVAGLELIGEAIEKQGRSQEEITEDARNTAKMLALLESIAEGQKGKGGVGEKEAEGDGEIGFLGGLLGIALGGLVGAIAGWAKAVKFFFNKLTPKVIADPIRNFFTRVGNFFKGMGESFGKFFARIKNALREGPLGKALKFLDGIVDSIKGFFRPLTNALKSMKSTGAGISKIFAPITNGIRSIMRFFGGIGKTLGGFAKMFGVVSKIVGKIFFPLTIIMTLWDTVKGMIAGFSEGGIVGGILGAVEGFFNSLIFGPLDMLKDAIAWVLGFFGFDKAAEALSSFSFSEMFSAWIDILMNFFTVTLPGWFTSAWEYILGAITTAWEAVTGVFNEYIVKPIEAMWEKISGFFSMIGDLIYDNVIEPMASLMDEYIIQPLAGLFAPIGNWFKDKFRLLMGFLEDFGIPEIKFDIPLYGEVALGPWYPFRTSGSDEGTTEVESQQTMSSSVREGSDGRFAAEETMHEYTKTVGSMIDGLNQEEREKLARDFGGDPEDYSNGRYTRDETNILVASSRERETGAGANFQANDTFLSFDAKTGQATVNGEDVDKSVYMAGKMAAMQGASADEVEMAMARKAAYNQLSWWNTAKALAGADPIELLQEQEGRAFNVADLVPGAGQNSINENSIAVADANRPQQGASGNTVVSAPTNVSNSTIAGPRRNPRNQDPTSQFAFDPHA